MPPWKANKVPRFQHLKFTHNNLKCIKINIKPIHPRRLKKAILGGTPPQWISGHMLKNAYYRNVKLRFEDLLACLLLRSKDQQ